MGEKKGLGYYYSILGLIVIISFFIHSTLVYLYNIGIWQTAFIGKTLGADLVSLKYIEIYYVGKGLLYIDGFWPSIIWSPIWGATIGLVIGFWYDIWARARNSSFMELLFVNDNNPLRKFSRLDFKVKFAFVAAFALFIIVMIGLNQQGVIASPSYLKLSATSSTMSDIVFASAYPQLAEDGYILVLTVFFIWLILRLFKIVNRKEATYGEAMVAILVSVAAGALLFAASHYMNPAYANNDSAFIAAFVFKLLDGGITQLLGLFPLLALNSAHFWNNYLVSTQSLNLVVFGIYSVCLYHPRTMDVVRIYLKKLIGGFRK